MGWNLTKTSMVPRGMSRNLEGEYRELENSQRAGGYFVGCCGTLRAKSESSQNYIELAG